MIRASGARASGERAPARGQAGGPGRSMRSSGRGTDTREGQRSASRAFWVDPRFGIGIALVVASVLGVVLLVSTADRTSEVWAARSALSPGETVATDDLVLKNVRLGDSGALYLDRDSLPPGGLVVTHAVAEGELVPESAVGDVTGLRVASVVLTVAGQLPEAIAAGSVVDVWAARESESGAFGPPSVLVGSATVVRVLESEGLIVDGSSVGVEVLVPRGEVASVLESIANDDAIALVPVALPVGTAAALGG